MRKGATSALAIVLAVAAAGAASPGKPSPTGRAGVPKPGALYENGPSGRYLLGGRWLFRPDPTGSGLGQRWQRSDATAGWRGVRVPYVWNVGDFSDSSQAGSIGWYRRDFRLPSARESLRWRLRFESVNYRARVWLNGKPIGRHMGAYLPFELPALRVKRHGLNRLVIRVDSRRGSTDLPPGTSRVGPLGGGWWNYGGLQREVYLRRIDRGDLAGVTVRPHFSCPACPIPVLLRATVRNVSATARSFYVSGRFGGKPVFFSPVRVGGHASRTIDATLQLNSPRLWSPAHPHLYALRLTLTGDGEALQTYRLRTGIRRIQVTPKGEVLLNGHRINLRGASIHEDNPRLGSALGARQRLSDIRRLRQLHATITRAHYPLHPQTLELADRYGILVWDQIPVYQLSASALNRGGVRRRALAMLRGMVLRDRDHPSVLAWSVGNELPSHPNRGQSSYLRAATRTAKQLDPSRLVALDIAAYPSVSRVPAYRNLDAIGMNEYFGWYPGPNGQILARQALGPYLDRMHRLYPHKGLFVTEFGAEANRHGPIDEKGTFEFQRDFLRFHLQTIGTRPFIAGAIMWLLRDFPVRPDWDGGNPKPQPPFNQKGILDRYGQPKPAYSTVAGLFRRTRQVR